jgi:hypothetical protein
MMLAFTPPNPKPLEMACSICTMAGKPPIGDRGRDDPYASLLPGLATALSACNATVSALTVSAGHELSDDDLHVTRESTKNWPG